MRLLAMPSTHRGMRLLSQHNGFGVGAQREGRYIGDQGWKLDSLSAGCASVTKADVDLKRDARTGQRGTRIDAHTAVAGILANLGAGDRGRIQLDAVVRGDASAVLLPLPSDADWLDLAHGPGAVRCHVLAAGLSA